MDQWFKFYAALDFYGNYLVLSNVPVFIYAVFALHKLNMFLRTERVVKIVTC